MCGVQEQVGQRAGGRRRLRVTTESSIMDIEIDRVDRLSRPSKREVESVDKCQLQVDFLAVV